MSNEILKRDDNRVPVLGAITNDANQEVRMLRVDPATGRLIVSAVVAGTNNGQLKVSSDDTTYGYLEDKLVAGTGVTLTVLNDGGNELLQIDTAGLSGTPTEVLYFNSLGVPTSDSLFNRNELTKETDISFQVYAAGVVNDGISQEVSWRADNIGTTGNSITLTFDGVIDTDTALANWNAANPSNTASVIGGTGNFVPSAQTITFSGGGTAGFQNNLNPLGAGFQFTGLFSSDGATGANVNGFIDSGNGIKPFIAALDLATNTNAIVDMTPGRFDVVAQDGISDDIAVIVLDSLDKSELMFRSDILGNTGVRATNTGLLQFLVNSYTYTWATSGGLPGYVLTTDGAGNLSFSAIPPASATLTQNYIGVGDSINELNGYASFQYDPLSYIFTQTIPNNVNNGTALGSPLTFGAANWNTVGVDDLTLNWSVSNYQSEKYGGNLTIQIDSTGTPDTFYWIYTGSYSQVLGGGVGNIPITAGPITLTDVNGNVIAEITFGSTTGHTGGESWTALTSIFGLDWGMLLTDQDGHEFVKVNTVVGSYIFGDDNTPTALSGNGTRVQITDNIAELGLFAKRYFRVEAPGGNTAVLADMQNDTWANYTDEFTIKNVTGLSTFFTLNTNTPSMTAAVSIAEIGNNGVGNNTYWQLSDSATTSFLRADTAIRNRTFLWEAGDLAGTGNGTKVSINDTTQKTTITSKQTIITGGIATSKHRDGGNITPIAIVDGDYIVYAGSGSIGATFNLPAASSLTDGYTVIVKDYYGHIPVGGSFYVAPNGADTIDGSNSSYQLLAQYQSVTLVLNKADSNWMIID